MKNYLLGIFTGMIGICGLGLWYQQQQQQRALEVLQRIQLPDLDEELARLNQQG